MKSLDISVTAGAKWLGVSRVTLSQLLNGHHGVTAEMAIRLEKAGWGSAQSWLRNQASHDLWQAKKRAAKIKVKRFPSPEPGDTLGAVMAHSAADSRPPLCRLYIRSVSARPAMEGVPIRRGERDGRKRTAVAGSNHPSW